MAGADLRTAVAVVVPAYRAAGTIGGVVAGIRAGLPHAAIVVTDDGSEDGTGAVAQAAGARVVAHAENRGKGAALASGIGWAMDWGAEIVATLDADGQHPPAALPLLVAPVLDGRADLVLGARPRTRPMPVERRLTNWLSARVASRVGRVSVPDAQTGFRAFSRRLVTALQPLIAAYRRYDYEAAFLLAALRGGYPVASIEVPTIYAGARSHFRHVEDGWRVARVFARYWGGAA